MNEFDESNVMENDSDLSQIMDVENMSDSALEFVKDNAAAGVVFVLAAKGLYDIGAWIVRKIKEKTGTKKQARPSVKEKLQNRLHKKKEKPEEEKAE